MKSDIRDDLLVVGNRIRILREKLGLSQAALARRLEIDPARVNHYELGRRPLPVDVATDLARLGKVSLDHLFNGKRRPG